MVLALFGRFYQSINRSPCPFLLEIALPENANRFYETRFRTKSFRTNFHLRIADAKFSELYIQINMYPFNSNGQIPWFQVGT
jgi:hypothetical protein